MKISITGIIVVLLLNLSLAKEAMAGSVFPVSTEVQIGKIQHLINKAPKGLYMTVGGDRAFREASMSQKIEHLIICDISEDIMKFNRINIELLKAPNKQAYKKLRWDGTLSDWQRISSKLTVDDLNWWNDNVRTLKYPFPEQLNRFGSTVYDDTNGIPSYHKRFFTVRAQLMKLYPLLQNQFKHKQVEFLSKVTWNNLKPFLHKDPSISLTESDFTWWSQERTNKESWSVGYWINHPKQAIDLGQVVDYKTGNYLLDDVLYSRVHNLVLQNKITLMQIDLSDYDGVDRLVKHIRGLNLNLSFLDLDNLYIAEYMGEQKFRALLSQLQKLGSDDSILILMHNYKHFAGAQFSIYLGFTFEHTYKWPQHPFFEAFINKLPNGLHPLIDGRLYEGNDQIPINYIAH